MKRCERKFLRRFSFLNVSLGLRYNNEATLDTWAHNLLRFVDHLRADDADARVFVSIYENDSKDGTRGMLRSLEQKLQSAQVKNRVVSEFRGNKNDIDRIDRLAYARNRALEPLTADYDYVIFLNDVAWGWSDLLTLVDKTNVDYDMVCGLDQGPRFLRKSSMDFSSGKHNRNAAQRI